MTSQLPPGSATNGHSNRDLLLAVLKAGTSKIKGLQFKCLMRAFFLVCSQPSSCCILTRYIYIYIYIYIERERESTYLSSYKDTDTGLPYSSVGKESTCNAGDPSSIPGSGRSTGEGIGYPLQYSGLENSMNRTV